MRMSNPIGFWNTKGRWKSTTKGSEVNENSSAYSFQLNKNWPMRVKNMKSTCQHMVCCGQLLGLVYLTGPTSSDEQLRPVQKAVLCMKHVCNSTLLLKWRQNQWLRLRPRTFWFVNPRECHILLGDSLPQPMPQPSITKQNTVFLPRINKSSCLMPEPWALLPCWTQPPLRHGLAEGEAEK